MDFGLVAHWHRSGVHSPFQNSITSLHVLWGTPDLVLSAQEELSRHSATPPAVSARNKR